MRDATPWEATHCIYARSRRLGELKAKESLGNADTATRLCHVIFEAMVSLHSFTNDPEAFFKAYSEGRLKG